MMMMMRGGVVFLYVEEAEVSSSSWDQKCTYDELKTDFG